MEMRLNRAATERSGTEQHEFIKKLATLPSFLSRSFLSTTLALTAAGLLMASGAQAKITTTGSVYPSTVPSKWIDGKSGTTPYIGYTADGTLTVDGGDDIATKRSRIGYAAGVTGTVTIEGEGSSWTQTNETSVGYNGIGYLNILNGGDLITAYGGNIGDMAATAVGTVNVSGSGSTWTSSTAGINVGRFGKGVLNILDGGVVTSGGAHFIGYDAAGGVGTVNVDGDDSTWNVNGTSDVNVGYSGTGALNITNGATVNDSERLYIGYNKSGVGVVTVDGKGSTLNMTGTPGYSYLSVGWNGAGELNILNGGAVTSGNAGISGWTTATGIVRVASGSTWTVTDEMNIGQYGTGLLSISGGSKVALDLGLYIGMNGGKGMLSVDVGTGSSLSTADGLGAITNYGTIRLTAGAGAAAGTYTPLSYTTLRGTGAVQALGGVWDSAAHTVAVNAASTAAGSGGAIASFNTATAQRALITDSATGKSVGAGFQAGTSDLTFGATAISGDELTSLQSLLADGKSVLSGWDFSVAGTTVDSTNPVYLSLWAGDATGLSDLTVWQYVSGAWSQFSGAYDLAYDGTYASFTATDLNTWAVTGTSPVPVPGAVWLLGSGLVGLVGLKKRGALKA